jgi:hypothetical protein
MEDKKEGGMSVRAYRVNEIVTEKEPSFNIWHDDAVVVFLERRGRTMNLDEDGGLFEVSIEDLEALCEHLKKNKKEAGKYVEAIKKIRLDIYWAKDMGQDYIQYYCY